MRLEDGSRHGAHTGPLVWTAGFGKLECQKSEMKGQTMTGGQPGVAWGPLTLWDFHECNGTWETRQTGIFEIVWTSGLNGAVTMSGFEWRHVFAGVECTYGGTTSEHISFSGGSPAFISFEEAPIPKIAGGFLCGSPAHMSATYEVTSPSALYMSQS